jgi:chemosensory pili system protein ChpA (sensor histidine kinase/response regulator)
MSQSSILVVDDDDDVRTMLCLVLSAEGYRAVGAADGVEALERLHDDGPPALVFVDLMMPRMSGEDLIRNMTQDPSLSGIPIAIISGQITPRTPVRTPHVVANLIKPVELDELLSVVHRVTD